MSGIDYGTNKIRKGASDSVQEFVRSCESIVPEDVKSIVEEVSRSGDTPLVVADCSKIYGVIRLKDVVKKGIKNRLMQLRRMGIQSVMITGDNPLTAASIAAEAGVDDFVAEARPETKLEMIRKYQSGETQHLVAMIGDGTNDAPALAQADVAVAMSAGTAAAREAANMVDLDSSPAKLLDIVEIGKEILITRGALTTFRHSHRRCQVLRNNTRTLRCHLSRAQRAKYNAPLNTWKRSTIGSYLQRFNHPSFDTTITQGC